MLMAWLALLPPVLLLAGFDSVWRSAAAVLICLVPGLLVLGLQSRWKAAGAPGFGALLGAVLRMLFVSGAMLAIAIRGSGASLFEFGVELSVFYLVSLAVETQMIVRDLKHVPVR